MLNVDTSEIEYAIVEELSAELSEDDAMFNEKVLGFKVKNAIREVCMKRNYQATSYDEEEIVSDLWNYYSTIRNVALYDYNQTGIEFQTSSTENYTRTYMNRDDLFKGVHAFVGFIGL